MSGQDLLAALVALAAGVWLFRRWLRKRRQRVGCDTCAAALHTRLKTPKRS